MLIKCKLIYYTRLTSRTSELKLVKFTGILLVVTWIGCMLSFFLQCRPFNQSVNLLSRNIFTNISFSYFQVYPNPVREWSPTPIGSKTNQLNLGARLYHSRRCCDYNGQHEYRHGFVINVHSTSNHTSCSTSGPDQGSTMLCLPRRALCHWHLNNSYYHRSAKSDADQ